METSAPKQRESSPTWTDQPFRPSLVGETYPGYKKGGDSYKKVKISFSLLQPGKKNKESDENNK